MAIFRALSFWLVPLLPLWAYLLTIVSFGHDDSHITFWAAHSLLSSGEILNYNGERVEQSSSLLFTIALAALGWLGADIALTGYVLGIVAAHASICFAMYVLHRQQLSRTLAMIIGAGLSCSPYFAAWSVSGMESTLAALCALMFVYWSARLYSLPSTPILLVWLASCAALAAVRPEMPLVIAAFSLLLCAVSRRPIYLLALVVIACLVLWRYSYFGQIMPNPVYAKASTNLLGQIIGGISYCLRLTVDNKLMLASCLFAIATLWAACTSLGKLKQQFLLFSAAIWVGIYSAFVIFVGGDWMREGRFWVPLIPVAWLMFGLLLGQVRVKPAATLLAALPVVLLLSYAPAFLQRFNSGIPIWLHPQISEFASAEANVFEIHNREHLRDWPAIRALQQLLRQLPQQQQVTIMSKQMGMVVFHLKREFPNIKVQDTAGLVENSLRNCAPVRERVGFDWQGLRLNYPSYFAAAAEQQICDLSAPDIIYDLFGWGEEQALPELLLARDYIPIFVQDGNLVLPGPVRSAKEVVAVQRSLFEQLKMRPQRGVFSDFTNPKPIY